MLLRSLGYYYQYSHVQTKDDTVLGVFPSSLVLFENEKRLRTSDLNKEGVSE